MGRPAVSNDLLAWCSSCAASVDAELEALADRRLALEELRRAGLALAVDRRSLSVSPEALLDSFKGDPIAQAGVRSLFRRALAADEPHGTHDHTKDTPEEAPQHGHIH